MFTEIATAYQGSFTSYAPFATINNREAWNQLDAEWITATLNAGKSHLNYNFQPFSATAYMEYTRSGDRSVYEDLYFAKRRALSALVLAECVANTGEFLDDIINGIFSICEESGWQIPAHNTYIRDTPALILPDSSNPILDLFACETGALLATTHYLLADKLETISPLITKRIRFELVNRIYTPYLTRHFWWMGHGDEPMCNWTIWCTQNVLLSVFLLQNETQLQQQVFEKACKSTDYFLKEYGEDGCCDEGAQYYRHSGLCLFNTIEILNSITDSAFAHLYENTKIKNIASYIMNVHIDDKYYVNFADCSPVAGRAGVREFLFAKRTSNPDMMHFAAQDFSRSQDNLLLPNEINLYYRLQNGFTISEIKSYHTDKELTYKDTYYESVGLLIARDQHYCLAAKAGDNADSHNHNDTGSFTLYKDGQPFLIDIGVETYCKKTFSAQRYEIWTMQSRYHNLPTINNIVQEAGAEYHAKDVIATLDDKECSIHMDISEAYPKEAKLNSYLRDIHFAKDSHITIRDCFDLQTADKGQVVLSLITYEKPTINDNIITVGNLGTINVTTDAVIQSEELPITDARLQTAWEHNIYRILITPTTNEINLLIQE